MPTISPFRVLKSYLPPPIKLFKLSHVHLYILSLELAEVGLTQVLSEYAASKKYSLFFSFAIVSSAATPAALSVFVPHRTTTTSMLSIRRLTLSFQSPVR